MTDTDFDSHDQERAFHAARLAELDAEYQQRPAVIRRGALRDPNFYRANREVIARAVREGRVIGDQDPLPAGTREFTPPVPSRRVYRRSELTDPAFFKEHREDILAAQREGRLVDDTGQLINRGGAR